MKDVWQRLGTTIPSRVKTAEEVLDLAGLNDWELVKAPLVAQIDDRHLPVDERVALLRNGNDVLGVVAPGYRVSPNESMVAFLNALVLCGNHASFAAAGELQGGREVFVALRWDDRSYLTVVNNHDGTRAPSLVWTAVQDAAVLDVRKLRLARSPGADEASTVAAAVGGANIFRVASQLRRRRMDASKLKAFLTSEFSAGDAAPPVRQAAVARRNNHILRLYADGTNRWDAYVAACQWFDHHGENQAPAELREVTRAYNAVFNPGWKDRFLEALQP